MIVRPSITRRSSTPSGVKHTVLDPSPFAIVQSCDDQLGAAPQNYSQLRFRRPTSAAFQFAERPLRRIKQNNFALIAVEDRGGFVGSVHPLEVFAGEPSPTRDNRRLIWPRNFVANVCVRLGASCGRSCAPVAEPRVRNARPARNERRLKPAISAHLNRLCPAAELIIPHLPARRFK